MQISKLSIKNFRSIESLSFEPKEVTAICGTNSSGKSNILRALRLSFRGDINNEKLAENVSSWVGPNAVCLIEVSFNKPTRELTALMPHLFPKDAPFKYKFTFKRSGSVTRHINKTKMNDAEATQFFDSMLVIYVPAIRDIATDGLKPFRDTLLNAMRKQKGATSLNGLNKALRTQIATRGKSMLINTKTLARDWMKVDSLDVDANTIDIDPLLATVGIRVKLKNEDFELSKLGTGQQSAVVLKLYRELGVGSGKPVIYLFEEPDNHLHPTSIKVVADELQDCIATKNAQVIFTTHSPYLLNHFEFDSYLPLAVSNDRKTIRRVMSLKKSPRDIRIAIGKYGLRPAEALLARRVIVVEGPNDVNVLRILIELHTGTTPECQDLMLVPAGGKGQVTDLCELLDEIGAEWRAVLDWDAVEDTNQPILKSKLSAAEKKVVEDAVTRLEPLLYAAPNKKTKTQKVLAAIAKELLSKSKAPTGFINSAIGKFVGSNSRATNAIQAEMKKAAQKGNHKTLNGLLNEANIFVWKGAIEEVAMPIGAEAVAHAFLTNAGKVPAVVPPQNLRHTLNGVLKAMAYEPANVAGLIEHMWTNKKYNKQEAKSALAYLVPSN